MKAKFHSSKVRTVCLVLLSVYLFPLEASRMRKSREAKAVSDHDFSVLGFPMTTDGDDDDDSGKEGGWRPSRTFPIFKALS